MDEYRINEWWSKQGDLLGAIIMLTPEEVRQLKNNGTIEIGVDE